MTRTTRLACAARVLADGHYPLIFLVTGTAEGYGFR